MLTDVLAALVETRLAAGDKPRSLDRSDEPSCWAPWAAEIARESRLDRAASSVVIAPCATELAQDLRRLELQGSVEAFDTVLSTGVFRARLERRGESRIDCILRAFISTGPAVPAFDHPAWVVLRRTRCTMTIANWTSDSFLPANRIFATAFSHCFPDRAFVPMPWDGVDDALEQASAPPDMLREFRVGRPTAIPVSQWWDVMLHVHRTSLQGVEEGDLARLRGRCFDALARWSITSVRGTLCYLTLSAR